MMSDLADYRWLVSPEAADWLARAAGMDERTLALGGLRRDLGAERARLVAEQVHLRRRAREKFPDAERMFFTRVGLEQATDAWIGAYKAQRFPSDRPLADLCSGIGGDLMALAARAPKVRGCDLDPVTALFAAANAGVGVLESDAALFPFEPHSVWHIDPDRRPEGKRTTHVEGFRPDLATLDRLLAEHPDAAVKLAPATRAPEAWSQRAEREWISRGGECRQQVAWFGRLARHAGKRTATVVSQHRTDVRQVVGSTPEGGTDSELPLRAELAAYLFEPDAAVIAAGLIGELAREHGLTGVNSGVAYLTGDRPVADFALDGFAVTDVLPFDRKQLAGLFSQRGVGRLEIKKRGCEVDPELLRKQLRLSGSNEATLLLSPVAGKLTAIVAQRVV